jgi:hypothetical protein
MMRKNKGSNELPTAVHPLIKPLDNNNLKINDETNSHDD